MRDRSQPQDGSALIEFSVAVAGKLKSQRAALVRYTEAMRQAAARVRPEWIRIVGAAESILGGR